MGDLQPFGVLVRLPEGSIVNATDAVHTITPDAAIAVRGWVRTRRDSKAGISFIACISNG
jgi:hypothetical protein